jgi:DNA-binding MarR family transcriptional regulator
MRSAAVRRRNALLESLELFRDVYPGITIGNMIAFLYTCENEGLTILDLAQVTGFYLATASRTIRAFLEPGAEGALSPELGLVEIIQSPRGKTLHLTEAGRRFRAELQAIIAEAAPITTPADKAA